MKRFAALLTTLLLAFFTMLPVTAGHATAAAQNLIPNPSVETSVSSKPSNWLQGRWGTNTTTFTYQSGGHSGSKSLYINMSKYSNGDAKWYFSDVAVTPGQQYTFSDYYKSSVATEVDVQYAATNGSLSYAALSSPAVSSSNWTATSSTFTVPANIKSLTIFHVINKVGWLQTDDYSLTSATQAPTPPTVSFTSPANNATVSGTQTISANASDAVGVANIQFKVDGSNIGSPDTSAPYSVSWDSKTVANGNHTISAVATNTSGLTTTTTETVNVQNVAATPPNVSITAPANGSTVGGTQLVSASASDAQGIASVQFKIDGNNVGSPATAAPYSYSWDTTTAANGNHTLSAIATNTSGLTATAATVTVNVQNTTATPPPPNNMISNASFETAQNSTTPQSWNSGGWGNSSRSFSYLNTGHTGSRSVEVQISNYSSGDANWYYNDVPVTGGKTYSFSDWYQSNVDTEVDAEVIINGSPQYYYLGRASANTAWNNFSTSFTAPAGATSMSIYHLIATNGYLITDDYSLAQDTATSSLSRPIVSITFDDGWADQYDNALPLLQSNGLNATFYIISGELNVQPTYMSPAQVKNLYNAGMEIGSHSITHPDLTTLSQSQLVNEMQQSQTTLQNLLGAPVTDFAYPYGAYNNNTIAVGAQYYQSQRTVDPGLNTKENFNASKLLIHEVDSDISQAQVKAWVDEAIQQKGWLILVYHEVNTSPVDPSNALYTTQPTDLAAELSYIKQSGVTVETVHQALLETQSQL
ncbi:MAG TPA: Ig-like domain-containing protein [Candidatus Saccharimonadales bacterium]|nr:Ig-like domain-containing protein [Candidatus Saccharimonadales bacterium]